MRTITRSIRTRNEDLIVLNELEKKYGTVRALGPVTAEWRRGEITALLGPNGAGKSTLVSVLLGLRRPTGGEVSVFGMEPGTRAFRDRVGAMLQESKPADGLKVKEVLEFFRSMYSRPMPLARLLAAAGLEKEAGKSASSLSGGQRRRLSFAISLAGDPDLLVLDEPTVAMDVESRERFWDMIKALAAAGKTVLLTTHHMEEADAVADRVVVLHEGRILSDGTAAALKSSASTKSICFEETNGRIPDHRYTALPGVRRIERDAGRVRLYADDTDALLLALAGSGLSVRNIEVREPTLEEAFRRLTKEGGESA